MLEFNITSQSIKRVDRFSPATDSVDYLTAKFNFLTDDWAGKIKKALFRADKSTTPYEAAINASGVCTVPWEVLVAPDNKFSAWSGGCVKIFVSVVGTESTTTLPTKECRVEMSVSGLAETLNGAEPTPDVYQQFVDTIKADNDTTVAEIKADNDETRAEVEALKESAETAATSAEQSAASMKNDYCNALKGTASGEVVRVDDVSPVEHTAKVKISGKNLIPYPYFDGANKTKNGITFTVNTDGSITVSGTATDTATFYLMRDYTGIAGNVFLQGCVADGSYAGYSLRLNKIIDSKEVTGGVDIGNGAKINIEKNSRILIYFVVLSGTTINATINPMLSYGETATEYTPYIDPSTVTVTEETTGATYTPAADGTCDIVSSPTMTLITDTEGVTIDLEYNRDINKVIADIYNKLNG